MSWWMAAGHPGQPGWVWLDGAAAAGEWTWLGAGRSLVAARPAVTFCWRGTAGLVADARGRRWRVGGDPLAALARLMGELRPAGAAGAFPGGAVGYFGYELGLLLEGVAGHGGRRERPPLADCYLAFHPAGLLCDRASGRAEVWCVPLRGWEDLAGERAAALERALAGTGAGEAPDPGAEAGEAPDPGAGAAAGVWSLPRARYLDQVERVLAHIRAGDIYQANLSRRLRVPWRGALLPLYLRLRRLLPEPFAAFLSCPGGAVLSASPELFLHVRGERVVTRPIKGTRPRGSSPAADARLRAELAASAKDRAELLMIVDLERNDLGKVCRPGSVGVPSLWEVESHPAAYQLVATVEGRLRPGVGPLDVLRAAFPGGSITGAPKRRAMEILAAVEPVPRGVYTGALGYVGFDGSMVLSIAIRTLVAGRGWVDLHVGGGIVADSVPEEEYAETLVKARGLADALGLGAGGEAGSG